MNNTTKNELTQASNQALNVLFSRYNGKIVAAVDEIITQKKENAMQKKINSVWYCNEQDLESFERTIERDLKKEKEDIISSTTSELFLFLATTALDQINDAAVDGVIQKALEPYKEPVPKKRECKKKIPVMQVQLNLNVLIANANLSEAELEVLNYLKDDYSMECIAMLSGVDLNQLLELRDTAFRKLRLAAKN